MTVGAGTIKSSLDSFYRTLSVTPLFVGGFLLWPRVLLSCHSFLDLGCGGQPSPLLD